jgi:hypothetical protein
MCSTFGASLLLTEIVPPEIIGFWTGLQGAVSGIAECVSTLAIARVYDHYNDGSDEGIRGENAMFVTAGISFLAVLAYLPLAGLVAKPLDKSKQEKKFTLSLDEYENLSDKAFKRLTYEEVEFYETKRLEEKRDGAGIMRTLYWGSYMEELPELDGLMKKAIKDFAFLRDSTNRMLTDRNMIEAERQRAIDEQNSDHSDIDYDRQKKEMGEWIAAYLDDAGYTEWAKQPQFFKVLIMSLIPPMDPLDGKKIDWKTADFEKLSLGFLKMCDNSIKGQKQYVEAAGKSSTMRVLRRR